MERGTPVPQAFHGAVPRVERVSSMRGPIPDLTWRHGTAPSALVAACGVNAAADVARTAGVWWVWVLLAGVAATLAATCAAARSKQARGSVAYRAACWACASGWATWALAAAPPWATRTLALAAGTLALGLLAPPAARHEQAEQARARREQAEGERTELAAEWVERIRRVCGVTVKVVGVRRWEFLVDGKSCGFSLDLDMPPGGKTWKYLRNFAEDLAGDARLPIGCGVVVRAPKPGPDSHRGAAVVEVSTVNALAHDVDYPTDYSPLTINKPLQVGVFRDGSPAGGEHRQAWDLTIGQTGSGKSNIMQVKNANFVRCADALLWVIDRNGGGLALPWALPWWERLGTPGEIAAPAVDWMAADEGEALLMARVALEIARGRKTRYQKLMRQVNDDKVPVSCDLPAIIIAVDEIDTILGENSEYPQLRKALKEDQNEGRGGAVRGVFGALRAVGEMIGGVNVKRQSKYRTGMMVIDMEELAYLFGSTAGISPEDIPYPGCGFLKFGQDPPRPFKAWRLKPRQIEDIAVAVAPIRPGLDAVSLEIAEAVFPGVYAGRWERARPWLEAASGGTAVAAPPAPGATTGPKGSGGGAEEARRRLEETGRRMRERADQVEAARRGDGGDPGDGDVDSRLAAVVAGESWPEMPTGGDPRLRMVGLLYEAGPAGRSPTQLADALSAEFKRRIHRVTVDGWLGEEIAAGLVRRVRRGVYVHADHAGFGDSPGT